MDDQTQFINVIFDPNFTSFEQDLATMSLDKMMSITYSEDVLQKNFTVIINTLKQLHKGMVLINGNVQENKDWVAKLRDITQATDTQDKLENVETKIKDFATKEELQALKNRFDNILNSQDEQIKELAQNQDKQQSEIDNHGLKFAQNDQEINKINEELAKLLKMIQELDQKIEQIKITEDNKPIQQTTTVIQQPLPLLQQPPMDPSQFKLINERLTKLEQSLNNQRPTVQIMEQPQETDGVDLSEINKKLGIHEEDIIKLFEQVDELRKKMREQNQGTGGPAVDGEELLLIKADIKKLFALMEQLQTQLNLASFGGAGEGADIEANQMALILAEINKLRVMFGDYATQGDLANELQKFTLKFKQVYDHIDEEIEKVRREFKNKLDKKVDQTDLQKIQNDMAQIRELLSKHRRESQIVNNDSPAHKGPQLDPDFLQTFKELQEQVQQIESELINHKSQFTQHSHQITNKVQELEKKIQGFSIDKIFQELQNLRELCDKLKTDSEQNKNKIKEFKNKIDQFMTKEEMLAILEPKLKALRDELLRLIEELKNKLDRKADVDDLAKVESNFLSKLEEVVQALIKQLANKQETKKALIYLEQKINQIFMILEGDGGNKEADGLFAKKPLLWSCASCDKELDKFKGQLGDYKGWAVFPPKETSPERMGRFGVGYKNQQEKQKGNREKLEKERYQSEKDRPNSQVQQQFYGTGNNNLSSSQSQLPKIKQT